MDKMRSIAILSVLSKTYSGVVLRLMRPQIYSLEVTNFAFRPGFQAHEPIAIIRKQIEKALEWEQPLFILDGDVRKAYDSLEYWLAIKGLRAKGVPKILVAAMLREIMYVESTFVVNKEATSAPVVRTRSLMQGGG